MYAARRTYVKNWDHQPKEERYSVQVTLGGKPAEGIKPERISYLEEEVMYWRKANHIHQWFVENVQDGEDDCKSYEVNPDRLCELLSICNRVIEASELVDGMIYAGTQWSKENPTPIDLREPGKVIKDPTVAAELLPTQPGFFFGCTEYDDTYLDNVVETRDWLVNMIADHERGVPGYIHYSSSW